MCDTGRWWSWRVGTGVVAPLVAWESARGKGGMGGEYVIEWSLQKGLGRGTILSLAAMGLHCHPHPTTIPFQTGSTCPSALLSGSLCYLPYQRPVLAFNTASPCSLSHSSIPPTCSFCPFFSHCLFPPSCPLS